MYYFLSTPSHLTEGRSGSRWEPRCGAGSTSWNKQEATRFSCPPATADCHVASDDRPAGRQACSPPLHTLFIHDYELLNGASGGAVNFQPSVCAVPPLTARHRRVSQGKRPLRSTFPRLADRQTPSANLTLWSWRRFFVTSPRRSSPGVLE